MEEEPTRTCSVCKTPRSRQEFSGKQWAAKAHSRKCRVCGLTTVADGAVGRDLADRGVHVDVATSSEELPELVPHATKSQNAEFQRKLETWAQYASQGQIRRLCETFVPLDLDSSEVQQFVHDLETDRERWLALAADVQAVAKGQGVTRILGDQKNLIEIQFKDPNHPQIDRAVVFTCTAGDWRAEG